MDMLIESGLKASGIPLDPHDHHIARLLQSSSDEVVSEHQINQQSFMPSMAGGSDLNVAHQTYQTEGLNFAMTTPLDIDLDRVDNPDASGGGFVLQDPNQ